MSAGAMFPQVDSLPDTKVALSIADGQGQVRAAEHGSDMSGHIIRTFRRVFEDRITVSDQSCHVTLQVGTHIGVGILTE